MKLGTFFDQNGEFFDTIHFPPSLEKYLLCGPEFYLLEESKLRSSLEIIRSTKMPLKQDPRSE